MMGRHKYLVGIAIIVSAYGCESLASEAARREALAKQAAINQSSRLAAVRAIISAGPGRSASSAGVPGGIGQAIIITYNMSIPAKRR